jgi:hypothetical protein
MADWRFLRNVILKAAILFVVFNLCFAALAPQTFLGRFSLYNLAFPGRLRFPFGENPGKAYNFSLYNFEAMLASHELAGAAKTQDEYRVLVIGDSSTWGTLLRPEQTLAGQLNSASLRCGDKKVRVFNLGYPTLSLAKDLMVLEAGLTYHPDLVLWPVTLEAFPLNRQLDSPLAANNANRIRAIAQKYALPLDLEPLTSPQFLEQSIVPQRRALADLFRLQAYGVMWAATGIDQDYPAKYPPAERDLKADLTFNNWQPPSLPLEQLGFSLLDAGKKMAGGVPIVVINEPILISQGKNSDIRYNFYYPRWAYDQYRQALQSQSQTAAWDYLDTWDLVPEAEFTNSAIHLSPTGEALLAGRVAQTIQSNCK